MSTNLKPNKFFTKASQFIKRNVFYHEIHISTKCSENITKQFRDFIYKIVLLKGERSRKTPLKKIAASKLLGSKIL